MTEKKKIGYTLACGWPSGLHKNEFFFFFFFFFFNSQEEVGRLGCNTFFCSPVLFLLLHSFKTFIHSLTVFTIKNIKIQAKTDCSRFESI